MRHLRVLIVEDDAVSVSLIQYMVEQEGHRVCGAIPNGGEVVRAVQRLRPDVVLMDVALADGVSGIVATRQLLRLVNVPIIVVSATQDKDDLAAIAESGALGFMKKPVEVDELRMNLRIAAHHHAVMRKLKDSELLHRSLFDNATVGIYVCHPEGYILACNQTFARMLGFSGPAELLQVARSLDEQMYVEPNRRAGFLARLKEGENIRDAESQVYGRDGDMIWIAEHLAPNFDEQGKLAYYESIVINISARKQAEEEKNLTYRLMQNTIDAIRDYIVVTDFAGNIILSNRAFEQNYGRYVEEERALIPIACTEGEDLFARFLEAVKKEKPEKCEQRGCLCLEGIVHPLDTIISCYRDLKGEALGAVFAMRPSEGSKME